MNKLVNEPELKYVLDTIRDSDDDGARKQSP